MRLTAWLLFVCSALTHAAGLSVAQRQICSDLLNRADPLRAHVALLSSDAMGGRLAGSIGEQQATQYVANVFDCLGLEPAGDQGSYFQAFNVRSGVTIAKNNSLQTHLQNGTTKHLILNQDWRPLAFSDNFKFESGELVFAGYGITAPALGDLPAYDSYHALDVRGKWVVVFRYTPEKVSDEQRRQLNHYASPRYKAFTAKDHGAKGIIFVSGPNSRVKNELIPLSLDASLTGSGIAALSVSDHVINDLLKNSSFDFHSLQALQDELDSGSVDALPSMKDIRLAGEISLMQKKKRARNVLARLRVKPDAAQTLVLSAHVDHLGHGELSGSRAHESEKKAVHHGADDNASGVAVVLEAAARLSKMKAAGQLPGQKDILFAVWSGEESGLLGSTCFVKQFMDKSNNKALRPAIDANLNLDMVGRFRDKLVLQGTGSSTAWSTLIERANETLHIPLVLQTDPYLPTDSTSFYINGVPTLNFFTGSHDEYHSPRDTAATLNYVGLQRITHFLVDMVTQLETTPLAMDYQQVQKTGDKPGRGFRVYLGTIPDYTSSGQTGVKLSGVTKDSPAECAGLKSGDVIVKLAGKKVHDIYDYTFVLNGLRVGEAYKLLVMRGKKRLELTIVARSRE